MVSCSKAQEIIYWDLNLKSEKSIVNIFEEEHENVIDVVVFAPMKTARTIIKARLDQENEADEQTGGTEGEESKNEESKNNGEKDMPEVAKMVSQNDKLKELREKMAALKQGRKTTKETQEEEKKQTNDGDDQIEVREEFAASGSRDKRIKIWNAKRGN